MNIIFISYLENYWRDCSVVKWLEFLLMLMAWCNFKLILGLYHFYDVFFHIFYFRDTCNLCFFFPLFSVKLKVLQRSTNCVNQSTKHLFIWIIVKILSVWYILKAIGICCVSLFWLLSVLIVMLFLSKVTCNLLFSELQINRLYLLMPTNDSVLWQKMFINEIFPYRCNIDLPLLCVS